MDLTPNMLELRMIAFFVMLVLAHFSNHGSAKNLMPANSTFPSKINSKTSLRVPGWKISYNGFVKEKVNSDKIDDLIVVLETSKSINKRVILLYLGEKKGGYKLHSVGKKAVFGPDDGGTMGDPFQGVDFDQKKKVLSIAVYGGSSHRWSGIYKYRFQKNDLHLIGTDRAYFWIPKGADVLKVETNYMTKKYHHIQTYKGKKTIRKHYDSMLVPISLAQFDAFMGEKHVKNILSKYYPY